MYNPNQNICLFNVLHSSIGRGKLKLHQEHWSTVSRMSFLTRSVMNKDLIKNQTQSARVTIYNLDKRNSECKQCSYQLVTDESQQLIVLRQNISK